MATVGRARQTAESLINSQLSRALYGEASEKDILLQYNAFCIGLLGAMLRNLAIFKLGKGVHMIAFFLHHLLGAMLRNLAIFKWGTIVHMVTTFLHHLSGEMLRKLAIFKVKETALPGTTFFQPNI